MSGEQAEQKIANIVMLQYVNYAGEFMGSWNEGAPSEYIEVSTAPEYADQPWLFPGWGPSPSQMRQVEDAWRATQMPIASENVTAIEFGDDSIPGTAAQWKAYWLALRAWTEGAEGYPDATQRPVQPT